MKKFGALVVDLSVSFESERDEGVRVVETCVLGFLPGGRPFRRATCTCRREVYVGVGDSVGDCDVSRDIFSALPWDERHAVRSLAVSP